MGLILNIDTSIETAAVSIAKDGKILGCITNEIQKEHASFLHIAIQNLQEQTAIKLTELDAIAVTEGPGSYTGLRVGMASAKGFAYALNKPFITVNTLAVLAQAVITDTQQDDVYYAPMIDARRLEVFTAVYDKDLNEILQPCAMVLDEHSYSKELAQNEIIFFGSGMNKSKALIKSDNALYTNVKNIPTAMSILTHKKFTSNLFTNLAHSEPLYIKEFYMGK